MDLKVEYSRVTGVGVTGLGLGFRFSGSVLGFRIDGVLLARVDGESHFCKVNVSLKYMDYARGQAETLLPDKPLGA